MGLIERTRRRFLELAGSATVVGLAGCSGGGGGQRTTESTQTTESPRTTTSAGTEEQTNEREEGEEEKLPEGVSKEEFEKGPVPEQYRTATSQGGEERDPGSLVSKESVKF